MVKKHEDFNNIINKGTKTVSNYFIVFKLAKDFVKPNFGIAIGKKVGNAVLRNKLKRQMRNIIDNNRLLFENYYNYIIMIKKGASFISYKELESEFRNIFRKDQNEK